MEAFKQYYFRGPFTKDLTDEEIEHLFYLLGYYSDKVIYTFGLDEYTDNLMSLENCFLPVFNGYFGAQRVIKSFISKDRPEFLWSVEVDNLCRVLYRYYCFRYFKNKMANYEKLIQESLNAYTD